MSAIRRNLLEDADRCPCAGATLEKLIQPAVLTVLAGGEMHGYGIVQRIAAMPVLDGRGPDAAGVYRTLRSMRKRELVSCSWDVSGTGPAKRLYRLTAGGRQCLSNWIETLVRHREAIGGLLAEARKAMARSEGPACGCGPKRKRAAGGRRQPRRRERTRP